MKPQSFALLVVLLLGCTVNRAQPADLPPCKYSDVRFDDDLFACCGGTLTQAGAPDEIEGSPFCACPRGGCKTHK